jgi:Purple acid Phosphatase, N-terminal domain
MVAILVALFLSTALANAQAVDLQISTNPRVQHVTDSAAVIQWSTNIPATSLVRYGMQHDDLNQTAEADENTQSHNVQLHNLRPGATYFYQVVSSANGVRAMTFVDEFVTSGDFVPYYTEPSNLSPR